MEVNALISLVEEGASSKSIIDLAVGDDMNVRTFFDAGELCFATEDDILITQGVSTFVDEISAIVTGYNWKEDSELIEYLANYEGSLLNLYDNVIKLAKTVEVIKPRKKTLAQKQGVRKAQRTKLRRP